MSYLDDANLSAQEALDKAINYASCGLFKDEEDLKKSFLSAMAGGDLYSTCGIDLENDDTGSITGLDAGGEKEKTAESIVPEEYNPYTGDVPTGTTNINGLNVTWPDTGSDTMKKAIAQALNSEWLKNCMDLVNESYELNFQEPGTSVHSMTVNLDAAVPSGTLARVISSYNGAGITVGLELQVNMSYYSDLDLNNVNGYDNTSRQTYLDRVIAHEMTHALMAANITNFATLPQYIKEGSAELVHGIDDERKGVIENLAEDNTALKTALDYTGNDPDQDVYAAGYMILRYMAHQAANAEPEKKMVFQIGTRANQAIKVGLADMRAQALGLKKADGTTLSVATQKKATSALAVIDRAITKALNQQTSIGAVQSRLDYTEANLVTAKENVQKSESTIRDADMAKEMTEYTKNNVLLQSAQAMLSQANQNSSSVLSLLQ
ncbi:MAG: flagellin [Schwartzia sp.]|nr:flagellin [Schwartzia sp. (in: firmicutes)]